MVPVDIIILEDAVGLHFEFHWVHKFITKSDITVLFNANHDNSSSSLLLLFIKNFSDHFQTCRLSRSWRMFI